MYIYVFSSSNASLPVRKVCAFHSGSIHIYLADIDLRAVLLRYIIFSTSYCDAGAFVDSEIHQYESSRKTNVVNLQLRSLAIIFHEITVNMLLQ